MSTTLARTLLCALCAAAVPTGCDRAPGKSKTRKKSSKTSPARPPRKATVDASVKSTPSRSPDIGALSVVSVERDLTEAASKAREIMYRIEAQNDSVRFAGSTYQKVVRLTGRKYRIIVSRPKLKYVSTTRLPHRDPLGKLTSFLKPSPNLQSNAPLIRRLSRKALRGTTSSKTAAMRLTRFVHDHITAKGYSMPAATALDVARLKQGDCTEHAYLLAAMGRTVGLPSRVASGLVFARKFGKYQRVFVYHMWTEFLIGKTWIPFDATRPDAGVGATHILLATDAMDAMLPLKGSAALMRTLGLITIKVEAVHMRR